MPLYDYKCRSCGETTEVRHGFKETFEGACPKCGGVMARVFNPAGIVFKGSGFYVTDSRKGGSGGESAPAKDGAAAKDTGSTSDGGTAAKSDSTPAAAPAPPKSETAA